MCIKQSEGGVADEKFTENFLRSYLNGNTNFRSPLQAMQ